MKPEDTFNILFICSGNSCRSPMAEGLLKIKLPEALRDRVEIASAGTLGIEGMPAAEHAQTIIAEHGGDIRGHRSQAVRRRLVAAADLILAMSEEHIEFFEDRFPHFLSKVHLLRQFARETPLEDGDIEDPIGGDLETYRVCADIIDNELERILPVLVEMMDGKNSEDRSDE